MRCSVVIPCHNGVELTRRCLDSLLCQTGAHEIEVLVVDNGSSDATPTLGQHHPCVQVLRQPHNRGFAGGVNAGLRQARHDFVLVLNNDTAAAENLLSELHGALCSDPRLGAVAPVSNHVKGPARLALGNLGQCPAARAEIAAALGAPGNARLQDVDTLAGLCLLLRRSTFLETGLFDERFGHGNFEDDDLCLRLRLLGYRLAIVRTAFLHHEGHATFRALGLELAEQITKRRAQFIAKWRGDPAGRAAIAALHGDLPQAADAATEARTRWPLWPDADWHLGRWHAHRGDAASAAHHFAALLRACPRHSDAALELGLQRLRLGDECGAAAVFAWTTKHCHVADGSQTHLLHCLGQHEHAQRRFAAAAAHFRNALDLAPADGALHNWLGLCLLEQGELAAAAAAFAQAIECGFSLAHTNLGICHQRAGAPAQALHHFERAVLLLPHDPVARRNRAAMAALAPS